MSFFRSGFLGQFWGKLQKKHLSKEFAAGFGLEIQLPELSRGNGDPGKAPGVKSSPELLVCSKTFQFSQIYQVLPKVYTVTTLSDARNRTEPPNVSPGTLRTGKHSGTFKCFCQSPSKGSAVSHEARLCKKRNEDKAVYSILSSFFAKMQKELSYSYCKVETVHIKYILQTCK